MLALFGSPPSLDISGASIEARRKVNELTAFPRFSEDISDTSAVGEQQPLLDSVA